MGDVSSAIHDYTQAIEIQPNLAFAYGNRGNSLFGLGRHQEVISDFDQAIQISPDFANFYFNCALSKSRLGDEAAACVDLAKAASLGHRQVSLANAQFCQ